MITKKHSRKPYQTIKSGKSHIKHSGNQTFGNDLTTRKPLSQKGIKSGKTKRIKSERRKLMMI